ERIGPMKRLVDGKIFLQERRRGQVVAVRHGGRDAAPRLDREAGVQGRGVTDLVAPDKGAGADKAAYIVAGSTCCWNSCMDTSIGVLAANGTRYAIAAAARQGS